MKKITENDWSYILENWKTKEYQEIAKHLGVKMRQVAWFLKKRGLSKGYKKDQSKINYKYNLNHQYFKTIDNYNKAYILGFILADGSIVRKENKYLLAITLAKKDRHILEFIQRELESNSPIRDIICKCKGKSYESSVIKINSKCLITDLESLNITERKTYKTDIPIIPKEFIGAFLRGYFDGDGCISISYRQRGKYSSIDYRWSFTAKTKGMLENIKKMSGIQFGTIYPCKQYYVWHCCSKDGIRELYKMLYSDDGFYLTRKKNKFLEVLK